MNSLSVITELKGFGSICQVCHFCYCEEIDFYIVSLENALKFRSLIEGTQKHTNTHTLSCTNAHSLAVRKNLAQRFCALAVTYTELSEQADMFSEQIIVILKGLE